jgi:hypothetical protein
MRRWRNGARIMRDAGRSCATIAMLNELYDKHGGLGEEFSFLCMLETRRCQFTCHLCIAQGMHISPLPPLSSGISPNSDRAAQADIWGCA